MTHFESLTTHLVWIALSLVFGLLLAYGVHWLLVRQDYSDYLDSGGSLDILRFRRIRESAKREYRRQRERAVLSHTGFPLPPTLGAYVYRRECEGLSDTR